MEGYGNTKNGQDYSLVLLVCKLIPNYSLYFAYKVVICTYRHTTSVPSLLALEACDSDSCTIPLTFVSSLAPFHQTAEPVELSQLRSIAAQALSDAVSSFPPSYVLFLTSIRSPLFFSHAQGSQVSVRSLSRFHPLPLPLRPLQIYQHSSLSSSKVLSL